MGELIFHVCATTHGLPLEPLNATPPPLRYAQGSEHTSTGKRFADLPICRFADCADFADSADSADSADFADFADFADLGRPRTPGKMW